jgi:cell division protein FtsB
MLFAARRRARIRRRQLNQDSVPVPRGTLMPVQYFLHFVGIVALLISAFFLTVWRQTYGVDMEKRLRAEEARRDMAVEERVFLVRRIQELSSRDVVVRKARERLGMRMPTDAEIVFLAVPPGVARGAQHLDAQRGR